MKSEKEKIFNFIESIQACLDNAFDLIGEARLLFRNRRFSRAFCLAVFAEEEVNKSETILNEIGGLKVSEGWEITKNHVKKLEIGLRNYSVGDEELRKRLSRQKHKMRLDSIFVGITQYGEPIYPHSKISKDTAKGQIFHASHYADDIQHAFLSHAWDSKVRRKFFKYLKKRGVKDGKIAYLPKGFNDKWLNKEKIEWE